MAVMSLVEMVAIRGDLVGDLLIPLSSFCT